MIRLSRPLALLLAVATCLPGPAVPADLPDIGDTSGMLLSPAEERRLGEEFMRNLRRSVNILEDPLIEDYARQLGLQLSSLLKDETGSYTFFVIDDPGINAFAAPGGYIGFNSGLIFATQSESELASVVAHEIAHVNQKHLIRQLEKSSSMALPAMAAIVTAILLSTRDSEAGYAALSAGLAGTAQAQINFTRASEQEADRLGIQLLAGAGYDPRSMPLFFQRLQQHSRYSESAMPEILRTHPLTASRVTDSLNRAEQFPERENKSSPMFHLMRARLRVILATDPVQIKADIEQALNSKQYLDESAERYGYALALLRTGDLNQSEAVLHDLMEKDRGSLVLQMALADLRIAQGKTDAALKIYADALDLRPGNPLIMLQYATALLKAGRPAQAGEQLLALTRQAPDPRVFRLLAQAEDAAQHPAQAHAAMAEYYYLMGQTRTAITQLELALQQHKADDFLGLKLRARMQQLRESALQEKAAESGGAEQPRKPAAG